MVSESLEELQRMVGAVSVWERNVASNFNDVKTQVSVNEES